MPPVRREPLVDGQEPAGPQTTDTPVVEQPDNGAMDGQPPFADPSNPVKKKRGGLKALADRWKSLGKKQRIAVIGLTGAIIIGATAGAMAVFIKDPPPPEPPVIAPKVEPPKPTTEASRLTGVQISPELNKLPVTGIMIENSPDARPQAGLGEAGIVFEAQVEGGITRFLALYMEDQPGHIGPVRSVRRHFLDFLVPFDAAIAHAGGSAVGLAQIRDEKIKDIDHGANAGAFQRVSSRFAPHNLYTNRAKLLESHNARGYNTSEFTSYPRKEKEEPLKVPAAKSIDLTISRPLYNLHYDYHAATNSYNRVMGGQPHTDEKSGAQLSPKVVIALVTERGQDGIYSIYRVTGGGEVFVFQDGGIVKGTWTKADRKSPYVFKTADGKPLLLTPGRTWITLVTPGAVKHAP